VVTQVWGVVVVGEGVDLGNLADSLAVVNSEQMKLIGPFGSCRRQSRLDFDSYCRHLSQSSWRRLLGG